MLNYMSHHVLVYSQVYINCCVLWSMDVLIPVSVMAKFIKLQFMLVRITTVFISQRKSKNVHGFSFHLLFAIGLVDFLTSFGTLVRHSRS
jgi:hypothetical protein